MTAAGNGERMNITAPQWVKQPEIVGMGMGVAGLDQLAQAAEQTPFDRVRIMTALGLSP